MPAPAHYLAEEAKREALRQARCEIEDVREELIARIERLEAIVRHICPDKLSDV